MFTKNVESNNSSESKHFDVNTSNAASTEKMHADVYNSPGHNPFKRAKDFRDMDTNSDRSLSVGELVAARKKEGRQEFNKVVNDSAKSELKAMDRDKNGSVSYNEFRADKSQSGMSEANMAAQFRKMDKDGSGSITFGEIKTTEAERLDWSFKTMQKASEQNARKEFAMYDHNHDGRVSPHEYVDFGTGKPDVGVLPGQIINEVKHIRRELPHIPIKLPNLHKLKGLF